MKNVIFIFTLLGFSIIGCTKINPTNEGRLITEIESVRDQIQEITKDIYCTKYSHCQYIPVGSKVCGGPSGYQIYSSLIGAKKVSHLKELSKQSQELEMQYNKLTRRGSNCMVNDPPHTFCLQNTCR